MKTTLNTDLITNVEMEKGLIAALLMRQEVLADVTGWLKPEMFADEGARFIYSAIVAVYNTGVKPDYLTTEAEMQRSSLELYQKVNGIEYLNNALRRVRTSTNLVSYAQEIKRLYLLRTLHLVFMEAAQKCLMPESSPEQVITEMESSLLSIRGNVQDAQPVRVLHDLAGEVVSMHRGAQEDNREIYIPTGFNQMDLLMGGFHKGELYVLGGRPGDGKSAIALHIAMKVANMNKVVALFNLEMSNTQTMNRLFAGYTNIPSHRLRVSHLTQDELKQLDGLVQTWEGVPFYIDYAPDNSVQNIRSQVLLMKKRHGCDLAIIDYLHLLNGKTGRGETAEQIVGRNITALKRLALEADCAVIVLSQMNRQIENRAEKKFRPNLSDLRDSGVIEQAADGVFFIYRPERHGYTVDEKTGESLKNTCELIVRKNRNGKIGNVRLAHNESFSVFTEVIPTNKVM